MHRAALLMGPSGFIAVLAGWTVTEVGRQPYTVYNLLRTADSASPIDATAIAFSLLAFVVVYFSLFGTGVYYMLRQMANPPSMSDPELSVQEPMRAAGLAGARTGVAGQTGSGGQA
jgi:cytochrome d ubiquinol oxidase subunit I